MNRAKGATGRLTGALLAAAVCLLSCAPAQAAPRRDVALEAALRAHIEVLASDEFEGREPGTPGEAKTLRYLGRQWFDIGLVSGTNNPGKEWFAPVTLVGREPAGSSATFTRKGRRLSLSAGDVLMLTSGKRSLVRDTPVLFAGMIARVPFVDALNTTLDDSLPLTVGDFPEWGDPIRDVAAYRTIAGYSPYDNVVAQPYPHMLVTAGIRDPRVPYWEPAKWVAKIRASKTNGARIMLVTNMSAGHFDVAGRFAGLDEVALIQAFALDVTGMHGADDVAPGEVPPPAEAIAPGGSTSTEDGGRRAR